ncbi:FAD-binding oxidoreductase [Nocardia stercoris]|uniref:FAD-binding oxidoreductase n=1 Tax=Nocardia stercoris TaxID=2483361 RepID=A0A3M2KWI0_9NOCA|nr:FAD-binding oxidoreductase [Nocardia stercoris]RMI29849.1 FAD-binding oxidoreductase [Nocardia stercoris]
MTHNEFPAFTGPVFVPGDAGYDAEVAGFQTDNPHRPDLVVGAAHAEDVRAAVEYAARQGLPIAVQATGHGLSVPAESGVLISTRRLDTVSVDPLTRTARVGAGVRAGALIEAAVAHGLAPLNGSSPSVGVVGYHLGGGLGILGRTYGYAADHVRAIELVTADGRMRRLVPGDDLFGAVLGSGGNFGVVTALELALLPITEVYGGAMTFDTALVPAALEAWRAWTIDLPEELTSAITMMTMPDVPGVPAPLRGRYLATINIAFDGPAEAGEALVAPLRAVGPRLADTLRTMPYAETESIYRDPDFPHAYTATNAMLSELTGAAAAEFRTLTGPDAPVPVVAGFRHLGGALSRPGPHDTAVGHRAAQYVARAITAPGAAEWAQHDLIGKTLAPWTLGHHLNFVYGGAEHASPAQTRAGYDAGTYDRLVALKSELDPAGLFRFNRNIRRGA